MGQKTCTKCKKELPKETFGISARNKDGLNINCKPCMRQYRNLPDGKVWQRKSNQKHLLKLKTDPEYKDYYKKYHKKYQATDKYKLASKKAALKRYYGITLDEHNKLLISQNSNCAICSKNQSTLRRGLVVDHDHKTGKVRGLLCDACNHGIGNFQDNQANLTSAIGYLKKNACI